MITAEHPYYFISQLREKGHVVFTLSKYVYRKDSLFDERQYLSITGEEFTEDVVSDLLQGLTPEQELAFHSDVEINGRKMHIPMIDFACAEPPASFVIERLMKFLPKPVLLNLAMFASGRSYHAYSTSLLRPKEWIQFMGRLLLVNSPEYPEIIDNRWIGHRLIAGYSSLRWSNNTKHYLSAPRQVEWLPRRDQQG